MKELQVTYRLDEEQYNELLKLTEVVRNKKIEEIASMPSDCRVENNRKLVSLYSEGAICQKWLYFYKKM